MRTSVDVDNFLVERDVQHELIPARGRLRSPEQIAAVLDLPVAQVGKVIICESDAGPVAALVPADRQVDLRRLARALSVSSLTPVTPARASQLSGYLAEAIPPAGLPDEFRLVMDRSLATQEVLYFHGGEASALLKVRPKDLVKAARGKVASIAQHGPERTRQGARGAAHRGARSARTG